ncbi:OB-fold domain-containing protein [Pseudonocardia halophobica]|uniref:Zn-ribbon domain-containing OB-fold protein n=1 Tax=Pseudonocardia halophobica TaxID=29401 RepID=A0A9W6NVA2_9PSEU|nr:OB-fold domain-containing protein [Pseudonocardia halophobica]GLL10649.1 hypothetical protein GCM10017577_17890 [Pseudonocardia halophobica]
MKRPAPSDLRLPPCEGPLPDVDRPLTREYWKGTRRHELLAQQCSDCGRVRWLPKPMCPRCNSFAATWVSTGTTGTVFSFIISYRGFGAYWEKRVPYVVALVEMDDEPSVRLMTDLVGCEPNEVHVGMPVSVVFDDVTEEVTLPRFGPV